MNMAPLAERTVGAVLDGGADRHPDKLAVRGPDGSYTYRDLLDAVLQVGGGLSALGVGRQDAVLIMLDNHLDHVLSYFGVTRMGAVEVPINPAYKGSILSYVINNSGARTMIIEDRYCERIAAIAGELDNLETLVVHGGPGDALAGSSYRVVPFEEVRAAGPITPEPLQPWDLYGILYTSGTTGPSKGVLVSHAEVYNHYPPAYFDAAGPDDVTMVSLPLFHLAGKVMLYNALIAGASAVVFDGFHATKFWEEVKEYGCTFTLLLGAMANFLFRQPPSPDDADNPLRRAMMVPVIPEVEQFSERFGVTIGTAYGMTEASTPVFCPFGKATPKSCGYAREDFDIRIVDENDVDVKSGAVGEIVVRSKEPWTIMMGYHGMPEATAAAWRNLWFHTGDHAYVDDEGRFFFVDRKKDSIRRRGENVSSFEVEAEVNSHPAVLESAVIAVPSEHTEDDIKAVVVCKPDQSVSAEDLLAHLAERLPYFMVPRYLEFVDKLPKTPSEKIQKQVLREQPLTPTTWDREAAGIKITRDS